MSACLQVNSGFGVVCEAAAQGARTPGRVGIVEWAESNIRILKGPEQGRFRIARTPYWREVLEAFTDPFVKTITLQTASQVGKTTCMMIPLAYVVDQDPGDWLWVMPIEDLAREISLERIQPMIKACPALQKQFTGASDDEGTIRFRFLRMTLFMAWAKSPATLSSRPVRRVSFDETGKYPAFSGKEADPVKLGSERCKLFWNRMNMASSTPTVGGDTISSRYKQSDGGRYHVKCPACGEEQPLISSQLKWPAGKTAEEVRSGDLAWYECRRCAAKWTDRDKPRLLAGGRWVGERPQVRSHRGFHLNTLYSPWVRWSEYAAEFLEAHAKPETLMNFVNSWEGEVFVEKVVAISEDDLRRLRLAYAVGVVPLGGLMLTAGVDVQDGYCRYIVRAWGVGDESWLVDWGTFLRTPGTNDDLDKVHDELLNTQYEWADGRRQGILLTFVDSRYRTAEVYKLAHRNKGRMFAIRGASEQQIVVKGKNEKMVVPQREMLAAKAGNLVVVKIDTHYYKDMVHGFRTQARAVWHLPETIDETYLREVSAEHKAIERDSKGQPLYVWKKRDGFDANHYWDCEVYATAAADKRGFRRLGETAPVSGVRGGMKRSDGRPFVSRRN